MKGLDISFADPSQSWWEDRRSEGFEAMVQNLWTGGFASNAGLLAVAATNLQRARAAGFRISAYANASPPNWWSLKIQMDNIKLNAGAEWGNVSDVVIDAEIPGINQARVMELADALEAAGKVADVLYTARWFWTGHMGNDQNNAWLRFKLWNADYDGDPTIDFPRPYGPWTVATHKQYAGTTYIEGQAVDLNTFEDSWLEDDMTDDEVRAIVKEMKFQRHDETGKAHNPALTISRWLWELDEHRKDDAKHSAGGDGYTDADAVKAVKDKL